MSDNQIVILLLGLILVLFRLYFAFLDVRASRRRYLDLIREGFALASLLIVLAAVFWIEAARSVAILGMVAAGGGHLYGAWANWAHRRRPGASGSQSGLILNIVAFLACLGLIVATVTALAPATAWIAGLLASYMASAGLDYWLARRRAGDRGLLHPDVFGDPH